MPRVLKNVFTAWSCLLLAWLLAGCATSTSYSEGQRFAEQGRVDEALARFRSAMQEDPRSAVYRAAYLQTWERAVLAELERADRLAADDRWAEAQRGYERVLALDATNQRAQSGLRRFDQGTRHRQWVQEAGAAFLRGDVDQARDRLAAVLAENPADAPALALRRQLDAHAATLNQSALSVAYAKPVTIEFKDAALKQVFEVLSRSSGLNFLFDKDVRIDQKTSIYLKNSSVQSAVQFMLMANQLELEVLDANTLLIYPNTLAKQKEHQQTDVRTFYLTNADAKTVAATLKTIVKTRDVVVDEKLNMLIVRDSPDAIRLAEKLVALHDLPEPEVMLEVEILEVSRTRLQELGIKWPSSLSLTPLSSAGGSTLTLADLKNLSSATLGASLSPLTVNANQNDTDTNILANPRIRARNREKAKILIGTKVPNITTTSTSTGFISESVTYLDVGLKLDVEPTVHLDNDVAIKIALEVSNIIDQVTSSTGTVAYRIGTRTASTVLRLRDGENQVLAGLINDEDRRSANKVPGVGDVPVVGLLFGSTNDNKQKSEIVLSITPHLVRNIQRPDVALAQFHAGTETRLRPMPPSVGTVSLGRSAVIAQQGGAAAVPRASRGGAEPAASAAAAPAEAEPQKSAVAQPVQLSWSGPGQTTVGGDITVQLRVGAAEPLSSLQLGLRFDAGALQAIKVEEGDFFRQGGSASSFDAQTDAASGRVSVSAARTGDGGADRGSHIVTLQFRGLKPSDGAQIEVVSATATGASGNAVPVAPAAPLAVQVR